MMTKRAVEHLVAALFVVLVSAVAAPAGQASGTRTVSVGGGRSYTDVSAAAFKVMLPRENFLLINVHIPYAGEIERTDRFIPFNAIEASRDQLPARKDAKLVLYCRSGHMSAIAARTLVELGYTNVWNLQGGMVAWEDAGFGVTHRRR